jgi:hypothetical protein
MLWDRPGIGALAPGRAISLIMREHSHQIAQSELSKHQQRARDQELCIGKQTDRLVVDR